MESPFPKFDYETERIRREMKMVARGIIVGLGAALVVMGLVRLFAWLF